MLDEADDQLRFAQPFKTSGFITDQDKHAGDSNGLVSGSIRCCVQQKDGFSLEGTPEDHSTTIFTKYIGGEGCLDRLAAIACHEEMWSKLRSWLQQPELRTDRHGKQRDVFFVSTRKLFTMKKSQRATQKYCTTRND